MPDLPRILVVEDNPSNSELVTDLLEIHGYQVEVAADAPEAFRCLERQVPDLIIMDIQLPEIDGLAAARTLKSRPETRNIPILALTALAMTGDRDRILAAGCDAYLSKPLEPPQLLQTVRALTAQQTPGSAPDEVSR